MSARALIILATVLIVSKVEGNADLRGVVLANELSGPPMANVEVGAVAANPSVTDTNGKFTFAFPHRNPGDTIRLIVHKDGYVVVNDIQLELALPSNPEERPTIILLCKESEREEWARRFYRLKIVEAIDQTYTRKFAAAQNASAAELANLHQERDRAKEAAEKLVEEIAKQKLSVSSEFYRTATRLFLNGNVDQALVTLTATSTTTTTATEGDGTITEYTPGAAIVLKDSSGSQAYRFGKTVTYATRSGRVLDEDTVRVKIKVGVPVRVHYVGTGDKLIVDRVIVDED